MAALPTRITLAPKILFQELEGEAILLNLQNEHYYSLNDVGTRMWQLLAEHGAVATVVERLLDEYHVDEATLRQDLAQLLAALADAGLMTLEAHT
jgi:hypothetical protein